MSLDKDFDIRPNLATESVEDIQRKLELLAVEFVMARTERVALQRPIAFREDIARSLTKSIRTAFTRVPSVCVGF